MQNSRHSSRSNGIHPSLVDVAFVLVFLFLILSSLANTSTREARERTLPPIELQSMDSGAAEGSGLTATQPTVITIAEGPAYFLDDEELTTTELDQLLKATRPPEIEIRGDVSVAYGDVTRVLKMCRESGCPRVALAYRSENSN